MLVEVRLRPGIADPQGATIDASLPALGFDGRARRAGGQGHPLHRRGGRRGRGPRRRSRSCAQRFLTNPVIEDADGARVERDDDALGVVRVPRVELRARRGRGGPRRSGGDGRAASGTATAALARRRRRRAARRLRPRRLPAPGRHRPLLPGDGGGRGIRRRGRPGRRHLQRLPGAHRGGPASRARCRRTGASSSSAQPSTCGSRPTDSVLTSRRDRGHVSCGCRSTTSRATTPARPRRWPNCGPRTGSSCAMSTTPTVDRRHRRHLLGRAQRGRAHAPSRAGVRCPARVDRRDAAAALAARRRRRAVRRRAPDGRRRRCRSA